MTYTRAFDKANVAGQQARDKKIVRVVQFSSELVKWTGVELLNNIVSICKGIIMDRMSAEKLLYKSSADRRSTISCIVLENRNRMNMFHELQLNNRDRDLN